MGAGFCSLYCKIHYIEVRYIKVWVYVFYFRIASNAGRAVGVAVGCVIGMFPLLFYKAEVEESKQQEEILVEDQNKT